jgi:hypothetical protein
MPARALLVSTTLIAALAIPATPALAGGDDPDAPAPAPPPTAQPGPVAAPAPAPETPASPSVASARLRATGTCAHGRAGASVRGTEIASVTFSVDGRRVRTVTAPDDHGRFAFSMSCTAMRTGIHRGRALVTFRPGATAAHRSIAFRFARLPRVRPQFTG